MRRLTLGAMICLVSGLSLSIASEPGQNMAEPNTGAQVTHILEVTPDTLYDTLLTGATSSQNITITNLGTGTQTFDVTVDYLRPGNPLPLASWPTVRLPFIEDFEDGDYAGWNNYGSSTGVREVTDSTAAEGSRSFHSSNNHFEFPEGIIYRFNVGSQISRMSFYVRSNSADRHDAFVTVYSDSNGTVVSFLAQEGGSSRLMSTRTVMRPMRIQRIPGT